MPNRHHGVVRLRAHDVGVAAVVRGDTTLGATRSLLPLGFGGQAIVLAGPRTQPRAIRGGGVPVDADHGVVIGAGRAAAVIVRLRPVGDELARLDVAAGPEPGIVVA